MPILHASLQGRFGNKAMQWLFARSIAERCGADFRCDDWEGNRIFAPAVPGYFGPTLPRVNEIGLLQWSLLPREAQCDIEFRGYAQMQSCMTYTKRQAQEWLRISPEWTPALDRIMGHYCPNDAIVAHHRLGDFIGYSYPVVSRLSYNQAAMHYFGFGRQIEFVSEEAPLPHPGIPDDLSFLPDFYRLMKAPTLMRANSTFSFVAGLLGNGLVLSPWIDGLKGGVEHDEVRFEAGNHCKLADFDFCSDLHVAP